MLTEFLLGKTALPYLFLLGAGVLVVTSSGALVVNL